MGSSAILRLMERRTTVRANRRVHRSGSPLTFRPCVPTRSNIWDGNNCRRNHLILVGLPLRIRRPSIASQSISWNGACMRIGVLLHGTAMSEVARSAPNSFPAPARTQTTESVHFRGNEAAALRQECLRARASPWTPLAIRGLDQLILLCNWAQHGTADLFLLAP